MNSARKSNWSADVTVHSNALDLKKGIFSFTDPKKIATSLKRSADASRRRKAGSYRTAISMITFYMNRAGKNLSPAQKSVLNRAKTELKRLYARD